MFLLFIDTETNGLNPNLDNILEIGAVLTEYNSESGTIKTISEFQTLIQPRQELNETASRITGLINNDFIHTPKLLQAQENWINWLEQQIPDIDNTAIKIIGHSIIDFDIKFLNVEGWFLPTNHELIDTMFLAKILIPQAQAINLEFLTKMFSLENTFINQVYNLQAHRALFDTYCTKALFQKLLELLSVYKFAPAILNYLNQTYFKLDLNYLEYYQSSKERIINKTNANPETNLRINLSGEIIPSSLLKQIEDNDLSLLLPLLKLDLPKIWRLCLCQILCIKSINSNNPNWKLSLHGRDIEYAVINYLLELSQNQKAIEINKNLEYKVNTTLEDLLWQINQVAEDRLYLINTYNLANQLLKVLEKQPLELGSNQTSPINQIQLWLSSYGFLELSLQPFWNYHQFKYNYNKLTLIEEKVFQKFNSFKNESTNLIQKLNEHRDSETLNNPIINYLIQKLAKELENISLLEAKSDFIFHLVKNYIQIAKIKTDFDINEHFTSLFTNFPNSLIPTYLNPENAEEYSKLLGLKPETATNHIEFITTNNNVQNLENSNNVLTLKNPNYENLIINQINLNELTLILCGDNQSFKQCQNICFDERNNIPYLIIGESGSKTKILSKITNGFKGIVILKQKDLGYVTTQIKGKLVHQVILINKPYLVLSNYFKTKWADKFNINQSKILDLYLQSTASRASNWLKTD